MEQRKELGESGTNSCPIALRIYRCQLQNLRTTRIDMKYR